MKEEAFERAILGYLSNDDNSLKSYRSLTTIFEQFSRPAAWRSSFFDGIDDIDNKEELRAVLDQMEADGLLEKRMGERDYEMSYRPSAQGVYEAAGFNQLVIKDGVDEPTTKPESNPVDSSAWTGLPSDFVLSEKKRASLVAMLAEAERALDSIGAGNTEKAMARAYIVAARSLADAPEPPVDLIWEIIGRASDISGIASLFLSIIALFISSH